jgi:hypothetical protein
MRIKLEVSVEVGTFVVSVIERTPVVSVEVESVVVSVEVGKLVVSVNAEVNASLVSPVVVVDVVLVVVE